MPEGTQKWWWTNLDSGPALRDSLARLVDEEGGRDEVENELFEDFNDPTFRSNEGAQRRFAAQMRRRLRHRASRTRRS